MATRNGFRWQTRPPLGYGLDTSHPLAAGLVGCWTLGGSGGNLARPGVPMATLAGTATLAAGGGLNVPNFGDSFSTTSGFNITTAGFTAIVRCRINTVAGGSAGILFSRNPGDNSGAFGMNYDTTGSKLVYTWANDATTYNWTGGPTIPTGKDGTFLAVSVTGKSGTAYVNETSATNTTSLGTQTWGNIWRLGSEIFNPSGRATAGIYEYAFLWDHALDPGQIESVRRNPYGFVLAPASRRFFAGSGGGALAAEGSLTSVSTLVGTASLALAAAGSASAVSTLVGAGSLALAGSGSASAVSTLAGTASLALAGSGALASVSTLAGAASAPQAASGSAGCVATLTGDATLGGALSAAGALSCVSTLTGSATLALSGAASLASVATLAGSATTALAASGPFASVATLAGAASVALAAAGQGGGVSTLTGAAGLALKAAGSAVCVSTLTGAATVADPPSYGSPACVVALLLRRRRAAPGPPPTALPDFWTALVSWFEADSTLTTTFPGGVVIGTAASGQSYPYARFWDAEDQEPVSPEDAEAKLLVSTYGADSDSDGGDVLAANAGQLLARKLATDPTRPQIHFTFLGEDWREVGFLWVTPTKLRQLPDGKNGVNLWRYDLTFKIFMVSASSDS